MHTRAFALSAPPTFSHRCLPPPPTASPPLLLLPLQVTLEPYERDHAVVVGVYRAQKKKE